MLHYRRQKHGRPMTAKLLRQDIHAATCSVAGCDRPYVARGYCGPHHRRWITGGDLTTLIKRYHRGGRRPGSRVDKHGYVAIYEPTHPNANSTGYVFEHRKVMATVLGRALMPHETVHHKNGNRSDNRLVPGHELRCPSRCCNLELWSKSQPYGQRVEDKLAWARELVQLYG